MARLGAVWNDNDYCFQRVIILTGPNNRTTAHGWGFAVNSLPTYRGPHGGPYRHNAIAFVGPFSEESELRVALDQINHMSALLKRAKKLGQPCPKREEPHHFPSQRRARQRVQA